jgi:hypothetical protein
MRFLNILKSSTVAAAVGSMFLVCGAAMAEQSGKPAAAKVGLAPDELCGIFTPSNLAGVRWEDNSAVAQQLKSQSARAVWHDLPLTIRCGKAKKPVKLTTKDGSRFEPYAFFKYPKDTVGVGSDMTYVALTARNPARASASGGICTFDGTENKWFQSAPASKACIRM